jgi:hypothetical protein
MDDMKRLARRKGLEIGLVDPNEEEQAQIQEAAQQQQPDPAQKVLEAQAVALAAQAEKDTAQIEKIGADAALSEARVVETLAKAGATRSEALRPANDAQPARPRIRFGRELAG